MAILNAEVEEIKVGDTLKCADAHSWCWTTGKDYTVYKNEDGELVVKDDDNDERFVGFSLATLYTDFELVKKEYEYTEKDIQKGTVLTVVDNKGYSFWTVGKEYVVEKDSDNKLFIRNDNGQRTGLRSILSRLNNKNKSCIGNATLKIVRQPEPNEFEWFEGLELECVKSSQPNVFTVGKTYIVDESEHARNDMKLRIYSDNGVAYFKDEVDEFPEKGIEFKIKGETIRDLNKLTFEDLQKFVELSSEMKDKQDELEYHETHAEELKQALESLMNDVNSLF